MTGSLFARIRREAKKNTKLAAEKVLDGQEAPMAQEVTPLSDAELKELLDAATENGEELVIKTVTKEDIPAVPVVAKVDIKIEEDKNFVAVGLFYDSKKKKYIKVSIEYDPDSWYSKIVKTEDFADSSAVALYKINNYYSMKLVKQEEIK